MDIPSIFIAGGLILIALYLVLASVQTTMSFAPWVPSSSVLARRGLETIKPTPEMRFVDLGCGDGRIVFLAHRRYKLTAYGYENSLIPYLLAKVRQLRYMGKPVAIHYTDLYSVNLRGFDIIYVYGLPQTIKHRLIQKLEQEVKAGSYVLSYNFSLPHKMPTKEFHERWRNLYIYKF